MTFSARRAVAAVAATALAGCAVAPKAGGPLSMAPAALDAAAKRFEAPRPDLAAVYVFRHASLGGMQTRLLLNGELVGSTTGRSYLWFWVGPGKHRLVTDAGNDTALELEARPGATYFVRQDVSIGFLAPSSALQLVDEATGKAGVSECSLVDTSAPAAAPAAAPAGKL